MIFFMKKKNFDFNGHQYLEYLYGDLGATSETNS